MCGGDGSTCKGCDGVALSGKRLDSCGVCGGNDGTCANPYALSVPPRSCLDPGGIEFAVEVAWSGPSNHSIMDKVGVYGPASAGGVMQPWSGQCIGAAGGGHCTSDAVCSPGSACMPLWEVPAGASSGTMQVLSTRVSATGVPFQARARYLRCMGGVEAGVCTMGYQVAAEVSCTDAHARRCFRLRGRSMPMHAADE